MSFNIKAMMLPNLFYDLLIPTAMSVVILGASFYLQKIEPISSWIANIGNASMTIMFSHAALMCLVKPIVYSIEIGPITSGFVITVVVLFLSTMLHSLIKQIHILSIIFIGK